jgi:hypothetical protein
VSAVTAVVREGEERGGSWLRETAALVVVEERDGPRPTAVAEEGNLLR